MSNKNMNILFVDDEENILNALKRELIDKPYNLYFAKSADEAFKILKENMIAVLITDLNMPEINGLELLYSVKMNYPDTVRIILTAFTDPKIVSEALKAGETYRFITKPWKSTEELVSVIDSALEEYNKAIELRKEIDNLKKENEELKRLIKK